MLNLPQIQPHNELTQAVNARELHTFLQNKDHFATWIKDRILQYGFVVNQDFMTFSENSEKGRPSIEYAISLDMAKELAMVERNEQGKTARRYFIECEKQLRQHAPQTQPSRLEILQLALEAEKENMALKDRLTQAQPKIAHYDFVVERHELINASQVGGKVGISAVALNRLLDEFGVYNKSVRRNGRTFNHWFIAKGLGVMRQTTTGHEQALFTRKGEAWVIERLANEGVIV